MTKSHHLLVAAIGITTCATVLPAQTSPETQTVTGTVYLDSNKNREFDAGEKVLPGVGVSNGRDVVQTDTKGHYQLTIDDSTDAVFVIKPSGYITPLSKYNTPEFYYIHRPEGSPKDLKYKGVSPTGPAPKTINFPLYVNKESTDYKVLLFGDPQVLNYTRVAFLTHDFIEPLIDSDADFGISLGDIASNRLAVFEEYNTAMSQMNRPWYSVVGNHDINFKVDEDRYANESWLATYGPGYYSFNWGHVHYIALDNVMYHGEDEGKKYHGELDEKQLEFLKNDLKYVPKDMLVVPMMHIPIRHMRDTSRDALFALIKDYPHNFSLSAHRHFQYHDFFDSERGWVNAVNPEHHHLVASTCSGTWWGGQYDEHGVTVATQRDGSPNAYNLMTVNDVSYKLRTIGARMPESAQMAIHMPRMVEADKLAETKVSVNIFGGSEKNITVARIERVTDWMPTEQVTQTDPYHLENIARHKAGHYKKDRGMSLPAKSNHHALVKLPADLPVGTYTLHVKTTDMFNQTDNGYFVFNVIEPKPVEATAEAK